MSCFVSNSWVKGEGCEQFEVHLAQMEKILPLSSYKNTQTSQREVYASWKQKTAM